MAHDDVAAPGMSIVRPADPGWKPTAEAELAHLRLCWGRWYTIASGTSPNEVAARMRAIQRSALGERA
jgi:hypothetical protein